MGNWTSRSNYIALSRNDAGQLGSELESGTESTAYKVWMGKIETRRRLRNQFFWTAEVNISSRVGIAIPTRIFFRRAEIFKSGFFVQKYSNQGILCRNIGQVPLHVTQSCSADYLDQTKAKQAAPDCTAAVRIYIQVTLWSTEISFFTQFLFHYAEKMLSFWSVQKYKFFVQKYKFFVQKYYHVARLYSHILVQSHF